MGPWESVPVPTPPVRFTPCRSEGWSQNPALYGQVGSWAAALAKPCALAL